MAWCTLNALFSIKKYNFLMKSKQSLPDGRKLFGKNKMHFVQTCYKSFSTGRKSKKIFPRTTKEVRLNFMPLLLKYFSSMFSCISHRLTSIFVLTRVISVGQRAKRENKRSGSVRTLLGKPGTKRIGF